jgi:hypothetical protein
MSTGTTSSYRRRMATLHIEHKITDYSTWHDAFDRFAEARRAAGVSAERISRPIDDSNYVVVGLDFTTADQATGFLQFLEQHVWSTPANSPGLAGSPRTMILATES